MSEDDASDSGQSPLDHIRNGWSDFNSSARSFRDAVYSWLRQRGFVSRVSILAGGSLVIDRLSNVVSGFLPTPAEIGRTVTVPEISNTFVAGIVVFVSLANWILIRRKLNGVEDKITGMSNSARSPARTDGGDGSFDWPAFLIGAGLGGLIATEFFPDFVAGAAVFGGFAAVWYFPEQS